MNRTQRVGRDGRQGGSWSAAYVSALLAMGLAGGLAGVARGQNQAVIPVDVGGGNAGAPSAAGPQVAPAAGMPAAGPGNVGGAVAQANPAATQGIVPVDVGNGNGNGAAGGARPAVPAVEAPGIQAPPAAAAPVAPAVPAAVVTPPAPAPAAPAPAAPAQPAPATAAGNTAPEQGQTASAPAASAPANPNQVLASDGKAYPITGLNIGYKAQQPEAPPISELMNMEVKLGVVDDGYVSPRAGVQIATIKLGDIGKSGPQKIYRSGIAAIYGQIVKFYNARGIIGVFVVVDANDIDANDNDIRPADRKALQLVVVTSTVKQVRTVELGSTAEASRVDDPQHAFIRENSPLQPESATGNGPRKDLLEKDVLDDYVLRLNRYPGRRVDVAVSGTNNPGEVTLDYLVSENRPWYVYVQASNTGTKQTASWRERFGFVDNELTGHDDILSLDYMTAGFSASHAVIGSYELPFFRSDRVRYKLYGSWNEYTASDVGINNEEFTGNQWTVGNELIANVYQNRELFVDAVAGFRAEGDTTNNVTTQTHGDATFYEPYGAARLDRSTDIATTTASLTLVGYKTQTSVAKIAGLGRAVPTRDPVVLQFDFAQSAFLEPLIAPERFAAGQSTLANEVYFSMRGQYAFNDRLFPQAEDVAGGLYSVRGYPESIVAGDSVILATAEYRFHLPRILGIQNDPTKTPFLWDKSFRFSPDRPYGRPDWDLIFRTFVDVGEVVNSNRQQFEKDASLVGTGVGVELQYKQNFNLRIDWGAALTDIPDEVKAGSNRFHITTTVLY